MNEKEIVISAGDFLVQNSDGTFTTAKGETVFIGVDQAVDSPSIAFISDTHTGIYRGGADVDIWISSSIDDIYNLFFEGKTIKDHTEEYMEVIMRLPGVNKQQLDAIETLEFFRRQFFPEPDEK